MAITEYREAEEDDVLARHLPESGSHVAPFSNSLDRELNPDPWCMTVLDLFRQAVEDHPQAVAISDNSSSLTYAELWNFAAAFRDRLAEQCIRPGDRVGIAAGRSIATVAAMLGVVMTGGCYVPVDLDELPAQIFSKLAEQSDLRYWIADAEGRHSSHFAAFDKAGILPLESICSTNSSELAEIPPVAIDAESPLYVMFTSGSTGLPKGVVVPHRAVVRLVTGQSFLAFGPDETFLLHSPLSFDASTLELWGSLLHGGHLAVAPAGRLGLDDYASLLARHKVTTLWMTAALFHLAAEHAPEIFAPLRQLIFGGDVIAPRHVERMRKLYPTLRMVNGYGPTENATFTCCYIVPAEYRAEGSLPIGQPITSTTIQILDENQKEVAPGQEGELVAGGAGVALGYLGNPEANVERFLPDLTSARKNAKWYRTGDRVRQRPDGAIEFLGRVDNQMKIAGHRVELGAIESALSASPLVADAAVVTLVPPSGEKQLVACVALSQGTREVETQLRQWLGDRLSRASIPRHWMFLDKLPINVNGKLDRNALRLRSAALLSRGDGEPATTKTNEILDQPQAERYLQQLWKNLLGANVVGLDDNFFDLGGTSLLLIEMHARLKAQFSSVPSVVDLFALPTPRALAQQLIGRRESSQVNAAEERGQRQRAAMLARRMVPVAGKGTR